MKSKASPPPRPSRSLATLKAKAKLHKWQAMLTFKPNDSTNGARSNRHQRYLIGLLRREFRGMSIGFLLVREFGTGRCITEAPDRSHFHVVLTETISPQITERLKNAFLRRCKLFNNQSRAFNYIEHSREGEPTFGEYVSKLNKGKHDVIRPPISWNPKELIRIYHYGKIKS